MEKVTEAWRKFNKEIPVMNYLPNIIRMTGPKTMIWAGYVARIVGEEKYRQGTGRKS
jgi:hypothetical protein